MRVGVGVGVRVSRAVMRQLAARARPVRSVLFLLLFGPLLAAATAAATVPLEVYGRLPGVENIALSADASKIAFVRTEADTRLLVIYSLTESKVLMQGRLGELKLRELRWADSDHLLILTSKTGMPLGLTGTNAEWDLLTVYDSKTQKFATYPAPDRHVDTMNVVAGRIMVRHIGTDTVLFIPGIWLSDTTDLALFKVNLTTRQQTLVRQGSTYIRGWLVDAAGEVVAEDSYRERDKLWTMRIHHDGRWINAESTHTAIDVPSMLGFSPKGDSILISSQDGGHSVWELMSLQDGKLGGPLKEGDSLNSVIEDPASHRMIGGIRIDDQATYVFFDEQISSRWRAITDAFEGERVDLISVSADLMQFVVLVDGPKHGYSYQLINMNTAHTIALGDVYSGLQQANETRRITYEAADGLKIPAYLTLPPGKPATRLPLIVMPHGGPAARDTADFDWWAQALASQGYAVLKPNYRGSTVTDSFAEAGYGQYGKKMQTDLSDGVRYLTKEGIVDPTRVCIVGASYGGYAALAGVTLDSGVYRCAVSVAGISDLRRFLEYVQQRDAYGEHTAQRYWERFLGISGSRDPALDAISPIKHIDKINVPVMLVHGRDDTVVPFNQSDVMLEAMKKANKTVELVVMKKEDHWLSRSATRLQMLQSTVEFLRKNNPPD